MKLEYHLFDTPVFLFNNHKHSSKLIAYSAFPRTFVLINQFICGDILK